MSNIIQEFQTRHGLSGNQLAALMEVPESTLRGWRTEDASNSRRVPTWIPQHLQMLEETGRVGGKRYAEVAKGYKVYCKGLNGNPCDYEVYKEAWTTDSKTSFIRLSIPDWKYVEALGGYLCASCSKHNMEEL